MAGGGRNTPLPHRKKGRAPPSSTASPPPPLRAPVSAPTHTWLQRAAAAILCGSGFLNAPGGDGNPRRCTSGAGSRLPAGPFMKGHAQPEVAPRAWEMRRRKRAALAWSLRCSGVPPRRGRGLRAQAPPTRRKMWSRAGGASAKPRLHRSEHPIGNKPRFTAFAAPAVGGASAATRPRPPVPNLRATRVF